MSKLLIEFETLAITTTSIAAAAVPVSYTTASTHKGAELPGGASVTMDAARASAFG